MSAGTLLVNGRDGAQGSSGSPNVETARFSNGIALYGSLDLTRDKAGLEHARLLHGVLDKIFAAPESEQDLPDKVAEPERPNAAFRGRTELAVIWPRMTHTPRAAD